MSQPCFGPLAAQQPAPSALRQSCISDTSSRHNGSAPPLPRAGEGWGGGATRQTAREERIPPPVSHLRCDPTSPASGGGFPAHHLRSPSGLLNASLLQRQCAPSPACGGGLGWGATRQTAREERIPPPGSHLRCDPTSPASGGGFPAHHVRSPALKEADDQ